MLKINKLTETVHKPWGEFCDYAERKGKWHLKTISVKKGCRLSLQQHKKRAELWIVAEGTIRAQKNKKWYTLHPEQTIFIKKLEWHRIEAVTDAVIIEITFGEHDEDDITRIEDDYGRI